MTEGKGEMDGNRQREIVERNRKMEKEKGEDERSGWVGEKGRERQS